MEDIFFPRKLYPSLKREVKNRNIVVITGSRQVGKTTLLRKLEEDFKQEGRSTIFLDLDLVENLEYFERLESFLNFLRLNGLDPDKKCIVFIDEFQHAPDSSRILKNLYDHFPNLKVYVSGSSSLEMASHLRESLAGRKSLYHLHPLSFEEFLVFKRAKKFLKYLENWKPGINLSQSESEHFWHLLEEFLIFGGYPKVVLQKTRNERIKEIKEIYDSYIKKDIKGFLKIDKILQYNKLIEILAINLGNLVNLNRISSELSISRDLLKSYLFLLEETFVIKPIRPFFRNKKKEIIKMPKIYFEDLGMRNLAINNFNPLRQRDDSGSILENYILNEILKANMVLFDLKFWRKKIGTEVDFILSRDAQIFPIEAKYQRFTKGSIPSGLRGFIKEYHPKKALVVNKNFSQIERFNTSEVEFVPSYFFSRTEVLRS